ncbi:hypothetical protein IAU60_003305 [Kwoniella sp. DSM 27419]
MQPSSLAFALGLLAVHVQAAITGQQYCNKYICITGRHDSDQNVDTYTLDPPLNTKIAQEDFGYMAIGFGTSMTNTPMVIAWPNSDGSITLSQRIASGHVMPTVVNSPDRKASLLTSSSFANSSSTSITFTIPSSSSSGSLNKTALIWAWSKQNPGSSSVSATIQQHLASGSANLALLATLPSGSSSSSGTASSDPTGTTGTSPSGTSRSNGGTIVDNDASTTQSHNVLIAHVVCGALATMAILPIGIIVPRLGRGLTTGRWWFPVHGAMNGLLGFGLITAAFAIAVSQFPGGIVSTHRKLGLTLFILAIVQTCLGVFTHFYKRTHKFQQASGRGPSNYIHVVLGLVVVGLGFGVVWTGIDQEWAASTGYGTPSVGWKAGWGVVVGLTLLVYLGGLYLLPRQLHNESFSRQHRSPTSSAPFNDAHDPDGDHEDKTYDPAGSPPPVRSTHQHTMPMRDMQSAHGRGQPDLPPLPPPPQRRMPPPL